MALPQFTTLSLEVRPEGYAVLELSRPAKSNAVSTEMWDELPQACSNLPIDWRSAVAVCHCLLSALSNKYDRRVWRMQALEALDAHPDVRAVRLACALLRGHRLCCAGGRHAGDGRKVPWSGARAALS